MKKITRFFSIAFSYLLFKWLVVLIALIKKILRQLAKKKRDKENTPRRIRKASRLLCVPIRHPNYHRPDPMIYSQFYLMKQGLAVTWDNPDIQLYHNGLPIPSHALVPDTEYEVVAKCWNLSYNAPVVGMPVKFSYLDFGAGTSNNPIGQDAVNLSVIGGSENPAFAKVKWRTPRLAGHYCIQVKLEWSDDINPENNLGQENVNVVEAHSPAVFDFKVKNESRKEHRYHVEPDAYIIPPLLPCDEREKSTERKKEKIRSRNSRENHPVPADWRVEYDEEYFVLNAGEEKMVKVTVTPPNNFIGSKPLNFNVFDEQNIFIGGVTVTIIKNNQHAI
jgi:hypothetical protein